MKTKLLFVIILVAICGKLLSQEDGGFRVGPFTLGEYVELPEGTKISENNEIRYVISPQGTFSIGPNFRLHPTTARHQFETPITRHPLNPNIMFASAITYNVGGTTLFSCGHYVSTDAGLTWFGDDTTVFNYGDPAPAIDYTGRLLISYITSTGNIGASYSTNNGSVWSPTVTFPGSTTSSDKCFSISDDSPTSPFYGRVYTVYTELGTGFIQISYTTNGGVSWSGVIPVSPTPSSGHFELGADIVTRNGIVYVAWANSLLNGQNSTEDSLGFAKSTDGGIHWVNQTNHAVNMNGIRTSDLLTPSDVQIRANGLPRIDVDKSNGNIYVTTCEKSLSPAVDMADVILMRSTDDGLSWVRKKVNQNTNFSYEYFSAIRVDEVGAINICYYSTRNTPTNDSAEIYLSRSTDFGETFTDIKVSDHKFKPVPVTSVAAGFSGDYIGLTSTGSGKLVPVWSEQSQISGGRHQIWSALVHIPTTLIVSVVQEGFYNNILHKTALKDTVRSYLRNSTPPYSIVDSAQAIMDSINFSGNFIFKNTPESSYYLVIQHRNCVETWSANSIPLLYGGIYNYDFDSTNSSAYGKNEVLVNTSPTTYAMYSGDVDKSGQINLSDVLMVYNDASNSITGYVPTDVTGDNLVDLSDMLIALNNANNFISISRP